MTQPPSLPRPGLASFGRRILFRVVFLLLAIATVAFALVLLQDEKERSYRNYEQAFRKTQAEVMAKLRHPAGLLALLNPGVTAAPTPLRPVLLPYAALDFDDQNKAQQAVEMAGCSVRWPDGGSLCAAVGNNAYAGGYLYLVGGFDAHELVPREPGTLDIESVHRARIRIDMRGQSLAWVAPFELLSVPGEPLVRGRLNAFVDNGDTTLAASARPVRDFRGLLWQSAACPNGGEPRECARRVFYSIRLPVDAFREAVYGQTGWAWPPADLDRIRVHVQMLPAGTAIPLFDSDAPGAVATVPLDDIAKTLLTGETVSIARKDGGLTAPVVLKGREDPSARSSPLILRLIDRLPVATLPARVEVRDTIVTPVAAYDVRMTGDARGIERGLGVIATRLAWYVGAMLAAIVLAWLVIEIGLIRRITVLTRRAAAVSHNVQKNAPGGAAIGPLDVSDLRGRDELGILAGSLADLLQRVKDDQQREQLRAQRERDMLQAVGHEILSPLQSLMVLHPKAEDPAHRYVQRMQQAVRVLYGQASPSEALQAAQLELAPLDLDAFLAEVAANAHYAGIDEVRYQPLGTAVTVRADAFSLEDVVTHVLRNADRHRTPGTPITLSLETTTGHAVVGILNEGKSIEPALLDRIFDYGVRGMAEAAANESRGQGLFVVKTYLAKMGGAVRAVNVAGGVRFDLELPRS